MILYSILQVRNFKGSTFGSNSIILLLYQTIQFKFVPLEFALSWRGDFRKAKQYKKETHKECVPQYSEISKNTTKQSLDTLR